MECGDPHLHVLAADVAFFPGGRCVALPPVSVIPDSIRNPVLF